jgi:tRNA 2-selenouridine synthase
LKNPLLQLIDIDAFYARFDEFDLIIDARSPKEYSESHLPTAVNLYALNDAEHQEVGTMYVQSSKSDAKVRGARYICQNASEHLQTIYEKFPLASKIGIYCARGGLRSTSLATIFAGTGYRVYKIDQGYKAVRKYILHYLATFEHKNFIVLGGNTGCGKSELLQKLSPAIDLEGLANHFGSTFGLMNGQQPTQKAFQNTLAHKLFEIEKNSWIFAEGESKKIGSVIQPDILYSRLQTGLRVEITAPLEQRVQRILKDYINIDDDYFYASMERITPYIRKEAKEEAIKSYEKRDLAKVAEILLVDYYDKVYRKPKKVDFIIDNSDEKIALAQLNDLYKVVSKIK